MTHLFPGLPWRAGWGVLLRSLGSSPGPAGCASSGGRVGPVGLLGHMARPAAVRVPGLRVQRRPRGEGQCAGSHSVALKAQNLGAVFSDLWECLGPMLLGQRPGPVGRQAGCRPG